MPEPDAAPPSADADAGAGCYDACVAASQMQARGIDAIEADCRRICAEDPTAYPLE